MSDAFANTTGIELAEGQIAVSATYTKTGATATIAYEMPETIHGLVDKFGEEEVIKSAISGFVVKLQAAMRRALEAGRDVQELVNWKPGTVFGGGSENPMNAVLRNINKLSPEERAALLASLQG